MERKRISGSQIRAVGYDPSSQVLEIEFPNGSVVQYSRVSSEIPRRLMASPSPGSFFQDRIEDQFTARRIR